jgi:cation diffusion facilitator family transporter
MHRQNPERWQHSHDYLPAEHRRGEIQTRRVIALTGTMMVVEIVAGRAFNSMALLADGWHMASHASALAITAFAYYYARRHVGDSRYSFGTWKVGVLGGYSSAVVLAVIAILIAWESLGRFFEPLAIGFDEAVLVACVGLGVNLASAWMLGGGHVHADHREDGRKHDHNLRAAYLHVLADALTSLTAIFALLTGKYFGWIWMDPLMGVVGSIVIGHWSYGLLRDTSRVLLDGDVDEGALAKVRAALEENPDDLVADLHLWRVGPRDLAALISIVAQDPKSPEHYKRLAADAVELSHVAVEVNRCPGPTAR